MHTRRRIAFFYILTVDFRTRVDLTESKLMSENMMRQHIFPNWSDRFKSHDVGLEWRSIGPVFGCSIHCTCRLLYLNSI